MLVSETESAIESRRSALTRIFAAARGEVFQRLRARCSGAHLSCDRADDRGVPAVVVRAMRRIAAATNRLIIPAILAHQPSFATTRAAGLLRCRVVKLALRRCRGQVADAAVCSSSFFWTLEKLRRQLLYLLSVRNGWILAQVLGTAGVDRKSPLPQHSPQHTS